MSPLAREDLVSVTESESGDCRSESFLVNISMVDESEEICSACFIWVQWKGLLFSAEAMTLNRELDRPTQVLCSQPWHLPSQKTESWPLFKAVVFPSCFPSLFGRCCMLRHCG